jgi:hypothetical protein
VFYLFEERYALQRVVIEVVFPGGSEKGGFDLEYGDLCEVVKVLSVFFEILYESIIEINPNYMTSG